MKLESIIWFSVFALLLTLSSCQDHRIPSPSGQQFRLKKVTNVNNSIANGYAVYNYDSDNRLINILNYSIVPTMAPYVFGRTTIVYDAQGRLLKVENQIDNSPFNPVLTFYYMTTYAYDKDDNITAIKKYKVLKNDITHPFLQEDRQLVYGNTKFPIMMTTKINDGSQFDPELNFSEEYTYTGGNIVEIKRTDWPTHYNGNNTYTSTRVFQYDDKPNPFYGLLFGIPDERTFSKNNVIEGNRSYTYDTNGLLTNIAQRDGSSETLYEYETY